MTKKIFIVLILIVTSLIIYSCDNPTKVEDNAWKHAFDNDTISIDTTMMGEMQVIIIKYVKQRDTLRDTIKINNPMDSTFEVYGKDYFVNFKEFYTQNEEFPFMPEVMGGSENAKLKIVYKLGIPTFSLELKLVSKRKELDQTDYLRNEFVKEFKLKTEDLPLLTGYIFDYKKMLNTTCEIGMISRDKKNWDISDNETQMNLVISNIVIEKNRIKKIEFIIECLLPTTYNPKYKYFKLLGQLTVSL